MENQVDDKTPEVAPRPRPEKWVAKGAPSYWRKQLLEELKKEREESQSDLQYAAHAAKSLSWMIAVMAVQACNLALLTAGILMFAVILHSVVSGAVLFAVAVAMAVFFASIGRAYPLPSRSEVFIGALAAMSFFAFTLVLALRPAPSAIPSVVFGEFLGLGVAGLALTGMSFFFPQWNPKKYTKSECAYYWAVALNSAWAYCWYRVMNAGRELRGTSPLDFLFYLAPIAVLTTIAYKKASKEGIKIAKKDDPAEVSLDPVKRGIHQIKRKRAILYTFSGVLGEAVVFGALVGNILLQVYSGPKFDSLRFGANAIGSLMLFAVWRYISRANRRADALLEAQLEMLEEAKRRADSGQVFSEAPRFP